MLQVTFLEIFLCKVIGMGFERATLKALQMSLGNVSKLNVKNIIRVIFGEDQ